MLRLPDYGTDDMDLSVIVVGERNDKEPPRDSSMKHYTSPPDVV